MEVGFSISLTSCFYFLFQRLDQIEKVYAARKGDKVGNNDMTFFALIVQMKNGNRFKILETKKTSKIKKTQGHPEQFIILSVSKFSWIVNSLQIIRQTELVDKNKSILR